MQHPARHSASLRTRRPRSIALSLLGSLLALACASPGTAPDAAALSDARPRDASAPLDAPAASPDASAPIDPWAVGPQLGARRHGDGSLEVRVRAPHATRIEVALFAIALGETERLRVPMEREPGSDRFVVRIEAAALEAAELGTPLYYGLRVWGPNWPFDPAWEPGSEAGFLEEIDADGNRRK